MVDYRKLRLNNLTSPEFRHLFLLLFWAFFGLCFWAMEQLIPREYYYPMWCPLDNWIPFNELFVIPYVFWFVFMVGVHVYLGLFDVAAFRRLMYFIMITYGSALVIFAIFPTCQNLRPTEFARDNFLTRFMADFYQFDTNTNVNPSLHVVGSMAVGIAACDTPRFRTKLWKTAFLGTAILISISTVFVKQHSIVDTFCGFLMSGIAYILVYRLPNWRKKRAESEVC